MDDRQIGARLQRLREVAGLTQQQAAQGLCISETAYRNYEAGRTTLAYRTVHMLAELFEMSRVTMERALGLIEQEDGESLEQWVVKRGLFGGSRFVSDNLPDNRRAAAQLRTVRGEVRRQDRGAGGGVTQTKVAAHHRELALAYG